jgi:hypothetical protein
MAWIFSKTMMEGYANSRYSQEQAEEYLAANFSDGEQCALWNGTHTQRASWLPDKTTDVCRLSRSGMMFKPLTDDLGEDVLMSFLEGFHVRNCQLSQQSTETTTALTETKVGYGRNTTEYLAKYCPDTHSLRTAQCLLFEDLTECCATLPPWGIMQDGVLLEQTPVAWIIYANESGLLPTVMASDWKGGTTSIRKDRGNQRMDQWRDYVKCLYGMTYPHPTHSELRMGFPAWWTDCDVSGTDRFQQWLHLHGKHYDQNNEIH